VLGLFSAAISGCKASAEVDKPKSASSISLPG
jgi:hypothetical protein